MSSISGLSPLHRAQARHVIAEGCALLLAHAASVHYTQGPDRWSAITQGLRVARGQYLTYGDCSSTATWLLWNALTHVHPHARDLVNGLHWQAGYTGTIAEHGKAVRHDRDIQVGDLILYGAGWPYEHVTVALGGGVCFSHGGEAGPFKLPIDYRADRAMVRRFI